jgi:hypothetical protein
MSWQHRLNGDSLSWLLEPDPANPAIRYYALRDLLGRPAGDLEVVEAQAAVMRSGPVPAILDAQHPEGYWQQPGGGYGKYRGTAWQIILLGDLAPDPTDVRVRRGCEYVLSHGIAANGGYAYNRVPVPSGVIHCLNGNVTNALIRLGWLDDPRVQGAVEWQARAITGEAPIQYYKSGTSGPGFACVASAHQPCAWGATKALKAFAAVPPAQRSPTMQRAVEQGAAFLLRDHMAQADYPYTEKISAAWFKLGFPLSYWSDLLETLAALVDLGYGRDPRLAETYAWLLSKQDAQGRWKLENSLNGKMWADIEKRGKPSKWITLRALRVIKAVEETAPVRQMG